MKLFAAAALLAGGLAAQPALAASPDTRAVLTTYADIAHAVYEDSLISAKALQSAIDALVAQPSPDTLEAARQAWIAARVPYQQSEVYRFGNPIVDDWEGRVNAWPLDEGLIDYVDQDYYGNESGENLLFTANVIASTSLTINGKTVDTSQITKDLLRDVLHEAEEVEANVATGYHAIEFLLWGQDLNGTEAGAGNRPHTDYDLQNCTGGNCDRRAAYLQTAAAMLVEDLEEMTGYWSAEGEARVELLGLPEEEALGRIVTGMGSLSYGELAGERMKLGLMLHDPEEEHDCFSDNTHNSHYYNALGIRNVYLGSYRRIDGTEVSGPSLSSLAVAKDAAADADMKAKLDATMDSMTVLVQTAEAGEAYDQMIGAGNVEGNAKVQAAIDSLVGQTRSLEKVVAALSLSAVKFEGSDSLDAPEKVGQ
ncbi:imelysin family protein [Telmatospirillum sp. J64-1]|uniref:imelysin family protein n=1 Tax=Telmatospirillum sp. J64-1 TaxID=2502183 RepID=UPI00115EA4DC|nr:imelysin family protein [Telmatospirillum sp. J64-1]